MMIIAQFAGEKISSVSEEAFSLFEKSVFGEKLKGKIEYSYVESLFLIEEGKMEIYFGNKKIDFEGLLRKLRKLDRKIEVKYVVFYDMRKKGYIVKTALKFGAEFRVYEKGVRPGEDHAKWILYAVRGNETMNWHDFSAKNRVAHSKKKNLLIGIVDEEGDVIYYEVKWERP